MFGCAAGAGDFAVGIVTVQYVSYNAYRLCACVCVCVLTCLVQLCPVHRGALSDTHIFTNLKHTCSASFFASFLYKYDANTLLLIGNETFNWMGLFMISM